MTHRATRHSVVRRYWWWFAAALAVVVVAVGTIAASRGPRFASDEVARVDGRSIRSAELTAIAGAEGLSLTSEPQVWRAVRAAERFIVLEQVAKQHGLLDDISYQGTLSRLQGENEQRQQSIAAGKTVYGVSRYNVQTYISAMDSSLRTALISKLEHSGAIRTGKEQLKAYYAAHASQYAKSADDISITVLRFTSDGAGQASAAAALEALQSGVSLADVIGAKTQRRTETIHIDQENIGAYSKYRDGELSAAQSLKAGSAAMVADDVSAEPLVLVCTSRHVTGLRPFADVRTETKSRYERAALDSVLRHRLANAHVDTRSDLSGFVRG